MTKTNNNPVSLNQTPRCRGSLISRYSARQEITRFYGTRSFITKFRHWTKSWAM